jgi:hypothetical protein
MHLFGVCYPSFQCVCKCAALTELVVMQGASELFDSVLQIFHIFINILSAWTTVQHVYLQLTQHISCLKLDPKLF